MIKYVYFCLITFIFLSCTDQKKPDFSFFYIANLNGNIENCDCGDPSLGGLDRIAKIINNERRANPGIKFIDAGLTLNPYPFPELDLAIIKAYKYIKPDIWLLTKDDLEKIKNLPIQDGLQDLNFTVVNNNSFGLIEDFHVYGKRICFYYLLRNNHNNSLTLPDIDKNAYNILVYSNRKGLNSDFKSFNKFDLILLANSQQHILDTSIKPALLGAGTGGEYLIKVDLYIDNNDFKLQVNNISIDRKLKPDLIVKSIINDFLEKLKQTNGA